MKKENKKPSQKKQILSKSSKLFWDKGYTETSMRDIGNACGFRPANIYNFFSSKEEILYEILLEEMEVLLAPITYLEDDETTNPIDQLKLIIENHVKLTLSSRRTSKLLFDTGLKNLSSKRRKKIINIRDQYDRITYKTISRGIKKGIFNPIDIKMSLYSIASMITRTRIWYSPNGRLSIDEIVDFIFNFTINGLSGKLTEKGHTKKN